MDSPHTTADSLLQQGMQAAKAGEKELARKCFIQALQQNPRHDLIWLCLASVTESQQMRLNYLNKVTELSPGDPKAEAFLRVTKMQFAEELMARANKAIKQGDSWQATHCLLHAVEVDPGNENAWLGLARLAEPPEDPEMLLFRVLSINPNNERARAQLEEIQAQRPQSQPAQLGRPQPAAVEASPVAAEDTDPEDIQPQEEEAVEEEVIKEDKAITAAPESDAWEGVEEFAAEPEQLLEQASVAPVADYVRNKLEDVWALPEPVSDLPDMDPTPETLPPNPVSGKPANGYDVSQWGVAEKALGSAATEEELDEEMLDRLVDDVPNPRASATLKSARDRCPLCDRELDEFTLQCGGCGGRLLPSAFIDRMGDRDSEGLDRRQIMLAAARYSRIIASDPDDASAHYKLAIAYLNLRHTEAALRCLRRSCELRPDATLAAEIIHLSRTQTRVTEAAQSEKAMRNSLEEFEAGVRQSVLIVDDSPTVRKSVATTLEKCGYQVISAADGHDGLAKIRVLKPNVVLLDVVMPRMDGYEVCKTIRETEKDLPIIMLSGKDGLFDKMRGKMAGCTAYLTKPFDNKALVETVRKYASAA